MDQSLIERLAREAGFEPADFPDGQAYILPLEELDRFAALVADHTKRKMLLDLWNALPMHESTGDTAASLRGMLMLSAVGDEIKATRLDSPQPSPSPTTD